MNIKSFWIGIMVGVSGSLLGVTTGRVLFEKEINPIESCQCDAGTYAELGDILRETEVVNKVCIEALEKCDQREFDRITHEISKILEIKNNSRRKKRK